MKNCFGKLKEYLSYFSSNKGGNQQIVYLVDDSEAFLAVKFWGALAVSIELFLPGNPRDSNATDHACILFYFTGLYVTAIPVTLSVTKHTDRMEVKS